MTMDEQKPQSVALATIPASTALEPQSINEALAVAGHLAKSGVLGRAVQKPEAALAVIMAGRELGLTAMQSLRSLHVIEGKVTLSSDAMLALIKRSPACKRFALVESTAKLATYETERVGEGVTRMTFTIDEAKTAGLTSKDNWTKYPAAMLRARCIASLARAVYPDVLMGVYEEDEIQVRPTTVTPVPGAVINADFTVEPTTEEQERAMDEKIRAFILEIGAAKTVAELQALAPKIKAEPKVISSAVKPIYDDKKKRLSEPQPTTETVIDAEIAS
jgi:hypothetical protein